MNTEKHCRTIARVSKRDLLRAVHECLLQLKANGLRVEQDGRTLDNAPAIQSATACLKAAGHIGFTQ